MLKKTGLLLVIICLFGIIIYAIIFSDDHAGDEPKIQTEDGTAPGGLDVDKLIGKDGKSAVNEESATMALKSIELVQGESGKMIWRLRTSSAIMRRQDGNIEVREPRLTYFLKPDDKELFVQAELGDIIQTENKFRFVKNVYITSGERSVAGDLLEYDGSTRTMTLPHASYFSSPDLEGSASKVIWRMDDSAIEALGNVNVYFSPNSGKAPSPAQQPEDANETPPAP